MDHKNFHSFGSSSPRAIYRPPIGLFGIVLLIGAILISFGTTLDNPRNLNLSENIFDSIKGFLVYLLPFYILVFLGIAKFIYTVIDFNEKTLFHRNIFFAKKVPIVDISKVAFGGTSVILKGTYRSIYIFYHSSDGKERWFRMYEMTFKDHAAIASLFRHLKEINPSIEFNEAAQQLMEQAKEK